MFKKTLLMMLLMAFMVPWAAAQNVTYTKVTANKTDWSGNYVIAWTAGEKGATESISSGYMGESAIEINENIITNIGTSATFEFEKVEGTNYYYIKTASGYLRHSSNKLAWYTYSPDPTLGYLKWSVTYSNNSVDIKNVGDNYHLIHYASGSYSDFELAYSYNNTIDLYEAIDANALQFDAPEEVTKNSAKVKWHGGTSPYTLSYRITGSGEEGWSTPISNATSPYQLTGLEFETSYDVKLVDNAGTEKIQNSYFTTLVACAAPGQPNAATNIARTSADITWTDEDHSAWLLCYATTTVETPDATLTETNETYTVVPCNTASYSFTNLSVATTYYVWVRANCGGEDGMSAWSTYRNFTTNDYLEPTNLSVNPTPTSATVTWESSDDAEQWIVKYSQDLTTWTYINNGDPINENTCELTPLTPSTTYYVYVYSYYDENHHDKYAYKQFTTLAACPTPTLSDPTNITATSASIDWTPGYEEEAWKVRYSSDNGSNWTVANDGNAITAHPYTLSGLTSATAYRVEIQAFCDPEESEWSDYKSFTTSCGSVNLPQFYNFDNSTTFPVCWNRIMNSIYPYITNGTGYAYSGSNCVDFYMSSSADEILIFPEINISQYPMANTQVKFMAKSYYGGNNDILSIGVMTDPADATTYTEVGQVTVANNTYAEYKVKFSDYEGSFTNNQTYIAFKLLSTSDYILVDDVTIEEIPACSKPTAFACTSVTANTATFSWTKGDNETAWQIAYSTTSGFDPDGATGVTYVDAVNANDYESFTISGFTAEQTYYARIRSNCTASSNGYSDWNDEEVEFKPTAAQTLTAYDGTDLNQYVPIEWYNGDNTLKCEFIVPASQISDISGKDIQQIKFYTNMDVNKDNNFIVFMKEIGSQSSLTGFMGREDATTVFEGPLKAINGEVTIALEEDNYYPYNGDNLLIGIYQPEKGDYAGSYGSYVKFYGSTTDNYVAWQGYSSTFDNITGSGKYFGPKTTFTYVQRTVTEITIQEATDITINSAQVNWTGGVQPYTLQYKKNIEENWSAEIEVAAKYYVIEDLEPGTAYDVRVKSSGDENYVTAENNFTTLECSTPTELEVATVTYCSATLTWTAGNALAWDVQYREADGGEWTLVENITEATYTINGLEELTDYTAKVRATCNTTWMSFEPFTTGTVTAIEVTPEEAFTENLEVSAIPEGWTSVDNTWKANDDYVMSNSSTALLLTPMLKITGVARISVKQRVYGSGTNTCTILATYDGGNTFMEGSINAAPTNSSATTNYYDIPAEWIGKKLQIAFKYEGSSSTRWQLYQVNIFMATTFTTEGNWNEASKWNFGVPTANIDAIINAAATIPYGTVAQADTITIGTGSLTIEDGGQLICNNAPVVTAQKSITAWDPESSTADGWYFIALPVNATDYNPASAGLITDELHLGDEGTRTYDFYYLDYAASKWMNYRSEPFTMANGQGYLYANANLTPLEFTGAIKPYDATYTVGDEGWNLVGNPYTFKAYVNQSHYTLNSDRNAIVAATSASAAIDPYTGVIVEGEATFYNAATTTQSNSNGYIQLALTQQVTRGTATTLDNAIVSFNEGEQLGKFYFAQQNANLYIPQGAEEYAIVSSNGQGEMPVSFKANENGQYTLTVNAEDVEMNYLHLIDNMTGMDIDLLQTPSYTFNATVTDYESRFRLVFVSNGASTGSATDETFAFCSNGNWIIANEGQATLQVVDLNGRILSSETVNGSVSKSINAPAGMYLLRLINGENVKVQKIVVR